MTCQHCRQCINVERKASMSQLCQQSHAVSPSWRAEAPRRWSLHAPLTLPNALGRRAPWQNGYCFHLKRISDRNAKFADSELAFDPRCPLRHRPAAMAWNLEQMEWVVRKTYHSSLPFLVGLTAGHHGLAQFLGGEGFWRSVPRPNTEFNSKLAARFLANWATTTPGYTASCARLDACLSYHTLSLLLLLWLLLIIVIMNIIVLITIFRLYVLLCFVILVWHLIFIQQYSTCF